jgi:hypothetical protein
MPIITMVAKTGLLIDTRVIHIVERSLPRPPFAINKHYSRRVGRLASTRHAAGSESFAGKQCVAPSPALAPPATDPLAR